MNNSSRLKWFTVIAGIMLAFIFTGGYLVFVVLPQQATRTFLNLEEKQVELGRKLARDIDEVLHIQPRVTVNGTVILKQTGPIRELATVQRQFSDTYHWENERFGSSKQIELTGDFLAKAGYDLSKPFSIDLSADGKTIRATLPPAKVLSVEQLHEHVIKDQSGWWNSISEEDREMVKNRFLEHAKESVAKSDLQMEADQSMMKQLEAIVRKNDPQPVLILHSGTAR